VLDATVALFLERSYEELTLQAVADAAGVSLKTVLRQFGSKDELVLACAHRRSAQESEVRAAAPGDVAGAARALADRYEEMATVTLKLLDLEPRFPAIAEVLRIARRGHLDWLAGVFAAWLPARPSRVRKRRLAQLFGATEIFVWNSWRKHLGLGRAEAEQAMAGTLRALVDAWCRTEGGPPGRRATQREGGT
jgi:AcrR family transcriptional regulator